MPAPIAIPMEVVAALRGARFVAVLTGAGVSAESGVPTFRDAQQGLWARFDPRELATPSAFARNPKRVWDWYAMRRAMVGSVTPNPAHVALATPERRAPEFLLITQNVDGLHQRAGSPRVVELHGNIARVKCARQGTLVATWDDAGDELPPRCPACGAFLRPDVVWFEELLPPEPLARAEDAARRCDVRYDPHALPLSRLRCPQGGAMSVLGRPCVAHCSSSGRRPRSIQPPRCLTRRGVVVLA